MKHNLDENESAWIVRRQRENRPFAVNDGFYDDGSLSLEAKGLLGYLLSRPVHWQARVELIRKKFRIGRDKAYRIINELIGASYMNRRQLRSGGVYGGVEYIVFDEPAPCPPVSHRDDRSSAQTVVSDHQPGAV